MISISINRRRRSSVLTFGLWAGLLAAVTAGAVIPASAAKIGRAGGASSLSIRIDGLVRATVNADGFSGTVLVSRQGHVLVDKGYGLANRARGIRATRGTTYRIFDITQQFTAMAILELQERGKLNTSDPFCLYIAGCPGLWKAITIQQLLTHTSGIPSFTSFPGYRLSEKESPRTIVARAITRNLDFAPGTGFEFSQTNYILLGLVIESASGEAYGSYMRENVFVPLGMTHTGLLRDGRHVPSLARGYQGSRDAPAVDATTPWSDGGLYTTAGDLYRWDQSLSTEKLVSQASLRQMFTRYVAVPPETRIGYGYGWLIGPLFNHLAEFHGGDAGGYQALNMRFPGAGITIIILSNQGFTDTGAMYGALVPLLFSM